MATTATSFRGVARVNKNRRDPLLLRFVDNEASQLSKTPPVKTAVLLAFALFRSLANIGQVFQNNRAALGRGLNDALTHHVVMISPSPKLFTCQLTQVALCRLGAFSLESTSQSKRSVFQFFPVALPQKLV